MYVILTYDVRKNRVSKVMKICRKYLHHLQRSVFEGEITEGKLARLKKELSTVVDVDYDAICIYEIDYIRYTRKEMIGVVTHSTNII